MDEDGKFSADAGSDLCGNDVLDKGQEIVLKLLQNDVIFKESFTHSYPYDWRTKLPVILRASLQWFIDTDKIKTKSIVSWSSRRFSALPRTSYAEVFGNSY